MTATLESHEARELLRLINNVKRDHYDGDREQDPEYLEVLSSLEDKLRRSL